VALTRRELVRQASALVAMGIGSSSLNALNIEDQIGESGTVAKLTSEFVARAESLKPKLNEISQPARDLVRPVPDPSAFLRWRMEHEGTIESLDSRRFKAGQSFIVDFGGHRTGYLSFSITPIGFNVDAPIRLRITFGEVPGDVAEPLHPYKGTLSEAWLPEEIITVDYLPQTVRMPRRYAFRYVKVEVIATSPSYAARFGDFQAHAVSSATASVPALSPEFSEKLRRIDEVSLATLRDCMQTVFEDGPRRDQRLWIGDLRLQALANYASFRNFELVRRCLYLLSAFPRPDGLLHADVFEKPKPTAAGDVIFDYAALFVAVLADYVKESGDKETGRELWTIGKHQLEICSRSLDEHGLLIAPKNVWIFIDWQPVLEHTASMHGVLLYSYRRALELAHELDDTRAVSAYETLISKMAAAARASFYDESQKVFVSGPKRQVSWASQAWLILAGVVDKEAGATALRQVMSDSTAVRPVTPYMYHHVVSALLACGQNQEAVELIENYWGAMVLDGADTFWEVFDPADSLLSPYRDVHINSFCHAWSCTPCYFLRTPGLLGR